MAAATGFAHSTVWKVLRRAGISRPPRAERESSVQLVTGPGPDATAPARLLLLDYRDASVRALPSEIVAFPGGYGVNVAAGALGHP